MAPTKKQGNVLFRRMLFASIVIIILVMVVTSRGEGATFATAKRCEPKKTPATFRYSCPAAFPESFTLAGTAFDARYQINWSVSCGGKTVAGAEEDGGLAVHVYAGPFSKQGTKAHKAFLLMKGASGLCTIRVAGRRISGHGRFKGGLGINVNHPAPIL